KYPINLISYEGWRDSSDKFKWICSRCNNIYHLTLHEKVTKKYYSCPYCNNILPLPEESLKITYPEIAEEWERRNRHIPIASKEIYAPLISKNYASKRYNTRLLGFFKCSKCGIIYRRKIQDVIDKIDCEYCNAGATKTNTIKVFNEAGIYDENDFILYSAKQYHNFKCSICNHTYNANILDCLLEQYSCPKCDNKVINEKTNDYYGAAEPPVRCGVSHLSELTEPLLEIAI
ncbi:MAG: hypothetical protein II251_00405, partial [Lachnospiraceae bacterium]|nr:hypothetical protein [Lachnospiraceae bacterium]